MRFKVHFELDFKLHQSKSSQNDGAKYGARMCFWCLCEWKEIKNWVLRFFLEFFEPYLRCDLSILYANQRV